MLQEIDKQVGASGNGQESGCSRELTCKWVLQGIDMKVGAPGN